MREDSVDVYLRHRDELLKAIYEQTDPSQEVGDFLLSTLNLRNQGIEYDLRDEDIVCLSYSDFILKQEGDRGSQGNPMADYRPAMLMPIPASHAHEGRVKRHWTKADNRKHGYKFHSEQKPEQSAEEHLMENEIPRSMRHALWPETLPFTYKIDRDNPDTLITEPTSSDSEQVKQGHYLDVDPFSEKSHPMRRRRSDTEMPEWEHVLRNWYFDRDGGTSLAEQSMGIEDAHKEYHTKEEEDHNHGFYKGMHFGRPGHRHSYAGGGDETVHQHDLRMRDMERWRRGSHIKDDEEREEFVRGLDKLERSGADMERAHFDWRMRLLDSNNVTEEEISQDEPSQEEIMGRMMDITLPPVADEEEAKTALMGDPERRVHGHGMGWETYNYGLEFLSPKERTKVLDHIAKYTTDDPRHQVVEFDDGQKLSMSRVKLNMMHRNGAEDDYFGRRQGYVGANVNANRESAEDVLIGGDEGMVSAALKNTYIKDGRLWDGAPYEYDSNDNRTQMFDNTAFDELMDNLEAMYEGDDLLHHGAEDEDPERKKDNRNLFPFQQSDRDKILERMNRGADLKEALKGMIRKDSDVNLSKEGLLALVGSQDSLHPIFGGQSGPLLPDEIMSGVLEELESRLGGSKRGKQIRNAMAAHRTGINAPHKKEIPEEEHEHYYQTDDGLRGLAWAFSKPFTHASGANTQKTTHAELLHDHLAETSKFENRSRDVLDDDGNPIGKERYRHLVGGESSWIGDKGDDGSIQPALGTIGLTSQLLAHFLPSKVKAHHTAHGIAAKTDTFSARRSSRGRNIKNSGDMHVSSRHPELFRLTKDGLPTGMKIDREVHPRMKELALDKDTFAHHNPYTETSVSRQRKGPAGRVEAGGDTSVNRNAAQTYLMSLLNGRINRGLKDPIPAPVSLRHFLKNADRIIPEGLDASDVLSNLPILSKPIDTMDPGFEDELLALEEQVNDPDLSKEKLEEIRDRLRNMLQDRSAAEIKAMSTKGTSSFSNTRALFGADTNMENMMMGDHMAVLREAKRLRPIIEREYPDAFHPDNPKALVNLHELLSGAMRSLHHTGGENAVTHGYEARDVELQSSLDKFATLSTLLQQDAVSQNHTISPNPNANDKEADMALDTLGLPKDDAHRAYAKNWLSTLSTDVIAMSVGKLAGLGVPWNANDPDMFSSLLGQEVIHDKLDEDLANDKRTWGPARDKARNRPNKEYEEKKGNFHMRLAGHSAINWLGTHLKTAENNRPVSEQQLNAYGLAIHEPPKQKRGKMESRSGEPLLHPANPKTFQGKHGRVKDIASHIVTFDPAMAPEQISADMPTMTENRVGLRNDARIGSLESQTGVVPMDVINDGAMHTGEEATAQFGIEFDGGALTVGGNPQPKDYNPIPRSSMAYVLDETHGPEHMSSIYDNHVPVSSAPLNTPGQEGTLPYQDDWQMIGKSDVPKEVPLIEPMHRIFELDDMSQLRGFTGEWVVSVHRDGVRCKVTRKGNNIKLENENGEEQSTSDEMRSSLRSTCKNNYIVDATLVDGELHINDILMYDNDQVMELTTRERVKLLRGQFDSYHPVHIPSPSDIRVTDEVGLPSAVESLGKDNRMLLLRDAKSTYMKGEEKHPKWVMLAKEDILYHVPFTMEIEDRYFIIRLPEDLVKYEMSEDGPVNPVAAIGSVSDSDYSIRLAKSLEPYWERGFAYLKKEDESTKAMSEVSDEGMSDERARRINQQSAGVLKPKKDSSIILKPKDTLKALLLIEKTLDKLDKGFAGHYPMSGGKGLGIDIGDGTESPRGPTTLIAEQSLPDWDMKKRPGTDPEKPDDYPGRRKKGARNASQYNENDSKKP